MTVISRSRYTCMDSPKIDARNAQQLEEAIRRLQELHQQAASSGRFTGQITVTIGYVDSVAQRVKDTRDRH